MSRKGARRFDVLREPNFRSFLAGYATSALGTAMATVALSFAILDSTGSLSDLSYVMAARIVPMVLFLLGGGVIGDRFPRRWIMIGADTVRAASHAGLAFAFLLGTPELWLILALAALSGLGEAVFRPSFDGLVPSLVPPSRLADANAVLGMAQSTAAVGGPALAGVLVAFISPAMILLIDAITFVPSILVLFFLRIADSPAVLGSSVLSDLRSGWRIFWSYPWLWTVTLQFTLFNLLVWAPYLVLGPASADRFYGGASAWGLIVAIYGGGSVLGGLLILGRRPQRPLVLTTLVTFAWAAPSAALALRAPLALVCVGALAAGISNSVFNTVWMTTVQQHVPADALSRVMSYIAFGAYSIGPVGLALAGPLSEATSISTVLAVGVGWQILANSVILTLPAIRGLRREPTEAEAPTPAPAGA